MIKKKPMKKNAPTSSQVHVPSTGDDESMLIKTKNGTTIQIGKQLELDMAQAYNDVLDSDDAELELETAKKWTGRACAAFSMAFMASDPDSKYSWIDWGDDLYHEALEHGALVKDNGQTVKEVQEAVEPYRSRVAKADLTTEGRKHVADRNFAIPETRSYPIHDIDHARNALARVSQHGTGGEKARVRAAVYRKYPSLKPVNKSDGPRRVSTVAVRHGNHMLMGKRRDNGKWTTPGGHAEPDENFSTAALRELLEETGIQVDPKELKAIAGVNKVRDQGGKQLHVQPFKVELSERPKTSMMNDPDGEVDRWQWVDVSQGVPKDITGNMHVPMHKNCLMRALGLCKAYPSDLDSSDDIYPQLDNLEAEILKAAFAKQEYEGDGGERFEDDDSNDSNNLDEMYSYQLLVEGMDWELAHTTVDPDDARRAAQEQLEIDPMHYRKLTMQEDGTDDVLAKDLNENDQNPWEPKGLAIDIGSGQTREPGYIGIDTYPYDHGTMVHDFDLGLPFPDESVEKARLCNVEMEDPKALLSEIHRVMMPGGQFVYEGPNDIYNQPSWAEDYPGFVLTDHESNCDTPQVSKAGDSPSVHRQTFTRLAVPDPATANDAEPRIGVAAYDELPADALLAFDAMSYYYSDATSSGRGNRLHGYSSQGALFDGNPQGDEGGSDVDKDQTAAEEDDSATHDGSEVTSPSDEDQDGTPEEEEAIAAIKPKRNPNPAPPQRMTRKGLVAKALEEEKIVPIFKANGQKQIVYGVVLAPDEIDAQDDFMDSEEIEKAAHRYMLGSRIVGSGHSKAIKAYPVESFIAPQDFETHGQYGNQLVKKGSWVLGVKIEDPEEWQKVKDGEYQGFSVGGYGARQTV